MTGYRDRGCGGSCEEGNLFILGLRFSHHAHCSSDRLNLTQSHVFTVINRNYDIKYAIAWGMSNYD